MRRTLGLVLLAVSVGTVIGCFTTGSQQESAAKVGPPTGDRDRTLEYWGKVREVMRQQSNSSSMRELASVVRKQQETVRRLPVDDVDRDLIYAANAVAQSQEKLLAAAGAADYNAKSLRADPNLAQSYSDAGQAISVRMTRLKALHTTLSTRYGVTFPPIDDNQK